MFKRHKIVEILGSDIENCEMKNSIINEYDEKEEKFLNRKHVKLNNVK